MQQPEQYNQFADIYSDKFFNYNQNSINAYFKNVAADLTNKKVLDLGCGDGHDLKVFKERGADIYGIDASLEMVALAEKNNPQGQIKVGHFNNIPFQNEMFDIVVSKWALQTAEKIDPIYREIRRVLKPNGELIYLACYPIRQFIEKKRAGKNYFKQEIVHSTFFDNTISVIEPSHTLEEYLSPIFFKYFNLHHFEEGWDVGAEKINNDIYPSYFIIHAELK
ncbi:MAG: uncharacterized protein K0R14_444 [Burkholderiales bacterium]|jgi:ubiquinone/menaquinone biosynthesis C-methylase UbiE|nr:uncharacterized protein [Burkholderiales bacterium]